VRALLFDSEARRVEGYSAQLPRRAEAAADCLDEMHRLVQAAGFSVGAVMGRAENEVTAEDRKYWPAFEGASWFGDLPPGSGVMLGSGCVSRDRFGLILTSERSMLGTVIECELQVAGLACVPIDEKRWLFSGELPEAGEAYASLKQAIKGSVEEFLDTAVPGDPRLAALESARQRIREVYEKLSRALDSRNELKQGFAAPQVIGCGAALQKSPAWTMMIAETLGVPLTLSTEPEPGCRGSALWALERLGAIEHLRVLPASMGRVFQSKALGAMAMRRWD